MRWVVEANKGSRLKPIWIWLGSFVGNERSGPTFAISLPDYGKRALRWRPLGAEFPCSYLPFGAYDKGEFN